MAKQAALADSLPVVSQPLEARAPDVSLVSMSLDWSSALADAAFCAEWDALAPQAYEANAFAERWYLVSALRAIAPQKVRLFLFRVAGQLSGVVPYSIEPRYAGLWCPHVTNWLNSNAFLGAPLVRSGHEVAFWEAFLAHIDQQAVNALFLHIKGLQVAGKLASALEGVCALQSRNWAVVQREERALLEHGLSPDAYLETTIRGKKRKELRRQHNRLAELGCLRFERSDGTAGLEEWISEFLALERQGWKGANGSALDCAADTRILFHVALHGAATAGKLELLSLRLDGRAIAMLVNFLTPPGAFSFKTAFDEDFARFSPGVLLQIENLKLLEREEIEWCDSCAAQDHPMIDSIWSGRRTIGRYSVAIGGPVRRAAFAALLTAEKAKGRLRQIKAGRPEKMPKAKT